MACRALSSVLLSSMIAVVFAGCDNSSGAPLVTAPNAPTSPANGAWTVDSTIVKADGPCSGFVLVGRTISGDWDVYVSGGSIWLDEGPQNSPSDDNRYEGTVDHLQFTATLVNAPLNSLYSVTLSGTFDSTFTAFEATKTETSTGRGCTASGPDLETETLESHLVGARR